MEKYSDLVIELYKKAIDKATINNTPTDYLEKLKKDVDFLKYQILV